jgi:hypothetical protein
MVRLIAAAALAALALGWGATGRAAAASGEATEKLLKESKFDYKKVKDGVFKLVLEGKPGTAIVYVEERVLGKDRSGNEILFLYIYTEVLATPADFKVPAAMLAKLNDVNDRALFGNVSLVKNKDGSHALFRTTTSLLKNLDASQLVDLLSVTYFNKFDYEKAFRGFLDGGQ